MTTEKKQRKDKEIVLELESQIKDVKHQLAEQLKCLDGRLDNHYSMTAELMDFYQKRAEVEIEYSKGLDKIVRQILTKHKAERQKRENWQNYSTYKLWQTLLETTSKQSRCHYIFSESLTSIVTSKFVQMRDDMTFIYKKCYEIAGSLHAELNKSMTELHSFLKTYQQYHGESELLQSKLFKTETRKTKVEQDQKKGTLSKKLINFDKKAEKHRTKVQESNLKALKARNEYLLSIDSTNAALRKYFIDDLPDLINAMDYSYHISLSQITVTAVDLEVMLYKLNDENLITVANKSKGLNQISDRQVFLQLHHQIFSLPKRFDFLSHKGDTTSEVQSPAQLRNEMVSRLQTIMERLHAIKLENDELWKTLETTDNSMVARLTAPEVDAAAVFQTGKPTSRGGDADKQAKEKTETQNFYFNKFKNYELNSNLVARLQAKCVTLEKVLALSKTGVHRSVVTSKCQPKRPAIGNFTLESRPKLFGGSIREYVKSTDQEIPLVIRSCTKIINLYGMHHQGVFRIPGLQHEINEYKNMFERGEEPILVKVETRDINSVAGVLKLYFRELSEPLFPLQLFDELVACSKYNVENSEELKKCIERLQELLLSLPRPILIVIRYLFAFLNHLSEYSDENMMDAHNLSVCFGPTLMPVPPDHDPVNHQNQINELVRILIVYQERIFPSDGGVVYEKFIIDEENDLEESVDNLLEGAGGDNSEEDSESYLEAVALHDFQGRSGQELTLKKGETLKLYKRVSSDWWEGAAGEHSGLVPHKFIAVNNRRRIAGSVDGEDKLFVSTESLPSRSASVTVAIRSTPAENDNGAFDRSVSQPNICDSPSKNRRKKSGDGKQVKDGKNDSALSSNSTITYSESSFSNLSDEQRPSLEGSIGSSHRKDSGTDGREPRKSLSKEAIAICKVSDGKKSSSQERKGESFSPLIPVLEIVEPHEIILEARELPASFSAVVTPVESVEVVTVVATTDEVVEASRGAASSPAVDSGKAADDKVGSCLVFASNVVHGTVVDQSADLGGNSLSPASLMSSPLKGSPEKSPNKLLTNSLTDSYFSFSLIPLESKPPLPGSKPGTPRSSISSPDSSDIKKLISDEQKIVAAAESCPAIVDTNIATITTATCIPATITAATIPATITTTTCFPATTTTTYIPATITTTTCFPATTTTTTTCIPATTETVPILHISEDRIAASSQNILNDQTPGFSFSESLPPPPDDLLADFLQESPEELKSEQQILSVGSVDLPSSASSQEKTNSDEGKPSEAEIEGSSPAELPTLSTPSFLRYMQNMQKQGGLLSSPSQPPNSLNQAVPSQLQLNQQFLSISDSIATASLGEMPSAEPGKLYTPPGSVRQSQDLTGAKSLDGFANQADSTAAARFSALKNVYTSQVPSTSSSTCSGPSPLAKIRSHVQGVSVQPSPRLAAMSFNLPTLSIYTTLAPTATSPPISVSSTFAIPFQSSAPQVLSSVPPPLALSPAAAVSSSQKPLTSAVSSSPLIGPVRLPAFSNLPPAKPWDGSSAQSISSQQQQGISSPGVSPSSLVPGEKSGKAKPPTMKKPGAKN